MKRIGLSLLACCFALGCHNVDLPDISALSGDGGGTFGHGPQLSALKIANQRVSLSNAVSFDVEDVNGVGQVLLSCSGIQLMTWSAPPYDGIVNFAPCVQLGTPVADAGKGVIDVTLTLTATDLFGNASSLNFTVQLDTSGAAYTLDVNDRVRPGVPLDFHVTSDLPLRGVPTVTVGGVSAEVTEVDQNHFNVHLDHLPLLGVDAYTGPLPPPPSVLEEVERPLDLVVDGVALNNNNTRLERSLVLSRVQWDVSLPAPVWPSSNGFPWSVDTPVAGAAGLMVPLGTPAPSLRAGPEGVTASVMQAAAAGRPIGMTPGVYQADGGLALGSGFADGGYAAKFVDAEGDLFGTGINNNPFEVYIEPELSGGSPVDVIDLLHFGNFNFVRTPGALCSLALDYSFNCQIGVAPAQYQCLGLSGASDAGSFPNISTSASNTTVTVSSGSTLLTYGVNDCATSFDSFLVGDPKTGQATMEPPPDEGPTNTNCFRNGFNVLPAGDGTFAVFDLANCTDTGTGGATFFSENNLVGAQGQFLGSYAVVPSTDSLSGDVAVTVLPDHRLVTFATGIPNSAITLWSADGSPGQVTSLPGYFVYPAISFVAPPADAVMTPSGLAVLVSSNSSKRAIIQLDHAGAVRWIYWWPGTQTTDTNLQLHIYGSPQSPYLYVIDQYNQRVVAIQP